MSWNYRVVRHEDKGQEWLAIHEVYYAEGCETPKYIIKDPIQLGEETVAKLAFTLHLMLRATEKPVLQYKDF